MSWLLDPTPPPYDPVAWSKAPLAERGREVCAAWALQGYGTPAAIYLAYALKIALYVAGWLFFCSRSPALSGPFASWWLAPIAFEKAIVWSLLFEVLGLGCGSGPLTGRYFPPVGGFLYFLRPGTTKLPLFAWLGHRRTFLDVALYAALIVVALRALLAAGPSWPDLVALAALVPLLGVLDKTLFLAARAEHYWATICCFAFAGNWIAGAKAVQLALWFWAGVSKLNHHFPTVVCVMVSNGPFTRFERLRRAMYRDFPRDLRPSRLATWMAHAGTALELGVPLAFLATPLGQPPVLAIGLMLLLHGYITSSVPMGVPLEWNVAVVYGGFALFWAHPSVSLALIGPPWFTAALVGLVVVLPLLGNLFPEWISFLLSMRYYAGNWAGSVWLFKGDVSHGAHEKLAALRKSSGWVFDQLDRFYDRTTSIGLVSKVMGFRLMHLHGRALPILVPRAVARFEDYVWMDGEIVAGLALGWNFGEGHLHQEQLLAALQAQCGFLPGELRCIFFESQPLGRGRLAFRIADAATGVLERGELSIDELRRRQPWGEMGAGA
ncbi:MAG TPA: DUF3556 domain-containing protein [Myxococcales bacterium]|nr:DUF3556 domain-containing protein [Myxococcales bacterium]